MVITAGSRGIEAMTEVLRELAALVRGLGAEPLILPAMGSHGGGTPRGQIELLEHLGQTPASLGAPIHDRMTPTAVGEVFGLAPVYVDAAALKPAADHVILVGRVKDHTEFIGPIESGLLKMAVVGLGRVAGATSMHRTAVTKTYTVTIKAMAEVIFQAAPVLGGIALVDGFHSRLHHLEAVPVDRIFQREPELLVMSQRHKPKLPFDRLDVLMVDEMGKNISGSGLDTKVVGRIMNIYEREPERPRVTRLVTLRAAEHGGGNLLGVGLNDFITQELADRIDWEMTNVNAIVSNLPEKGRRPIVRPEARSALAAALATAGLFRPEDLALAWITNTNELEYLAVTPALWAQAADRADLTQIRPPAPPPFRPDGGLPRLAEWIK